MSNTAILHYISWQSGLVDRNRFAAGACSLEYMETLYYEMKLCWARGHCLVVISFYVRALAMLDSLSW